MKRLEKCISITEATLESLRTTIELAGALLRDLPETPAKRRLARRWKELAVEFADAALSADEIAIDIGADPDI